jgi:ubiquinone/menaquinone biosynthesis C-methylase UbiE
MHSQAFTFILIILASYSLFEIVAVDNSPRKIIRIDQYNQNKLVIATATSALWSYSVINIFTQDNKLDNSLHKKLFSENIFPQNTVLEVGIGNGVNLPYYPANTELYGLDPKLKDFSDAEKREIVRKYRERMVNLKLIDGVCEELPFPNESFDRVVSSKVFCTVKNPLQSLSEISRVLKIGGRFICIEHILSDRG